MDDVKGKDRIGQISAHGRVRRQPTLGKAEDDDDAKPLIEAIRGPAIELQPQRWRGCGPSQGEKGQKERRSKRQRQPALTLDRVPEIVRASKQKAEQEHRCE